VGPPDETIQSFSFSVSRLLLCHQPCCNYIHGTLTLSFVYKGQQKGHNEHEMMQLGYRHVACVVSGSGCGMVLLVVVVAAGPSSQRVGFRWIGGFLAKSPEPVTSNCYSGNEQVVQARETFDSPLQ
jgi:hypothetical protein